MKVKHILNIILTILYFYWLSDVYMFMFTNNIYDPDILDDIFSVFKVSMVMLNYLLIIPAVIILNIYTSVIDKFIKILNKEIKFKKYEN